MRYITLQSEPIDVAEVLARVGGDATAGGICAFAGATRVESHPSHGGLVRLDYQVYTDMAVQELQRLADTACQRWSIVHLAIVHRTGPVELGQPSVLIAVACPHRAEAFEACRWLIDELKRVVPIWKREVWADGEGTWSVASESPRTLTT